MGAVGPDIEALRAEFEEVDVDGSGYIDADELFELALNMEDEGMDEDMISEIIGMMCDADADGNSQISFDEFVEHLSAAHAAGGAPPAAKGKSPPGKKRGISAPKKGGLFACCMGKKATPAAPVEEEEEEEEEEE